MAPRTEQPICVKDWRGLPFCQVDNKLIRSPVLTPYAKLVYVVLCGYANVQTVDCHPSIKTICSDLGISKPTVLGAIKLLCRRGVLEVQDRHDELGRDQSHHYAIKDWRETELARVNDVDTRVSQIDTRVSHVDGGGSTSFTPRVSHVDTKEIEYKEIDLKDNQVSQDAIAPESPAEKSESQKSEKTATKTKTVPVPKPKSEPLTLEQTIERYGEGSTQHCLKEIEIAYGDLIPYYGKQASHAKPLIEKHGWETVLACWKFMRDSKNGCWVDLALIGTVMTDYVKGRLPGQKGNGNGPTGRSNPQAVGNSANGATSKAGSATSGHLGQTEGEDSEERMLANRWKTT